MFNEILNVIFLCEAEDLNTELPGVKLWKHKAAHSPSSNSKI